MEVLDWWTGEAFLITSIISSIHWGLQNVPLEPFSENTPLMNPRVTHISCSCDATIFIIDLFLKAGGQEEGRGRKEEKGGRKGKEGREWRKRKER